MASEERDTPPAHPCAPNDPTKQPHPQPEPATDKDDAASTKGSNESTSKGVRIPRNHNHIPQNNTRLNPSKKRSRDESDDNDDDNADGDGDAQSSAKSNISQKKKVHLDAASEAGDVEIIKTDEEEEEMTEGKRDERQEEKKSAAEEKPATIEEEKPATTEEKPAVTDEKKPATIEEEKPATTEEKLAVTDDKKSAATEEKPAEEEKPAAPKLPNPFTDTSTISPFGRLAQGSTLSSFKSPSKNDNNKPPSEPDSKTNPSSSSTPSSQPSKLPFGSLAGGFAASPFATATGFAAAGKPKLSSFGSGKAFASTSKPAAWGAHTTTETESSAASPSSTGPTLLGTLGSQAKPLATLTAEAAEEEQKRAEEKAKTVTGVALKEDEDDGEKPQLAFGEANDEGDKRFQHKQTETGEEEETTVFSSRAKLFYFKKGEWKERGAGVLKVNVSPPEIDDDDEEEEDEEEEEEEQEGEGKEDAKKDTESKDFKKSVRARARARIVMRADGVMRVILNTPLFKGMKFGDAAGNEPTTKAVNLTAVEEGHPVLFTLRVHNPDIAKDLYKTVQEVLRQL